MSQDNREALQYIAGELNHLQSLIAKMLVENHHVIKPREKLSVVKLTPRDLSGMSYDVDGKDESA